MLTAYCNFAALFGISPESLSPSVDHLKYKAKGGPLHLMAGITAKQHAILQKLAWDDGFQLSVHAGVGRTKRQDTQRMNQEAHDDAPHCNRILNQHAAATILTVVVYGQSPLR